MVFQIWALSFSLFSQSWSCENSEFAYSFQKWKPYSLLFILSLIWFGCSWMLNNILFVISRIIFSFDLCSFVFGWKTFHTQDESQDFIKRQQLRELAMLNSNFREESPGPSGSISPFNTSGMKRAKTGRWKRVFQVLRLWSRKLMAEKALPYIKTQPSLKRLG